jgi:hypothetical protein
MLAEKLHEVVASDRPTHGTALLVLLSLEEVRFRDGSIANLSEIDR